MFNVFPKVNPFLYKYQHVLFQDYCIYPVIDLTMHGSPKHRSKDEWLMIFLKLTQMEFIYNSLYYPVVFLKFIRCIYPFQEAFVKAYSGL